MNTFAKYLTTLALGAGLLTAMPQGAYAQKADKPMPPVTLDLRDAPIRQALEQLFGAVKADFTIDNNVAGFVTLKVTDQPFENALKLILRASPVPLTYANENGVYIIKPRPIAVDPIGFGPPVAPDVAANGGKYQQFEVIQLTHIDAMDLAGILGIQFVPTGSRFGGTQGAGGGLGGFGGGGGFGTGGFGGTQTGFGGFGPGGSGGFGGAQAGGGQPGAGFGSGQFGNTGGGNVGGGQRLNSLVGPGIGNLLSNQAGDALIVEY